MSEQIITLVTGMEEPRGDNAGRVKLSYNSRYHDVRTEATMNGIPDIMAKKGWIAATVRSKKGDKPNIVFYDLLSWEPSGPPGPDAGVGAQHVVPTVIPTVSVMAKLTVNLGNYESASIELGVSGLPAGATAEDIAPLLDTGRLAYDLIQQRLQAQLRPESRSVQTTKPSQDPRLDPTKPLDPAAIELWEANFENVTTIKEVNDYQAQLNLTPLKNNANIIAAREAAIKRITGKES